MTIEKLDASTTDLTQQNIERLLELFPECRTEGSREDSPTVDFDLLRQALSDYLVEGPAERYRLDWPGKRQALLTANTPIDKTLRPMREESVDFDTTRNLFIEGDNLDALKLLQETYLGKVKMIYIDPPYNTGQDFVYKDRFLQNQQDYESSSNQRDHDGGRLVANTESSGRFHSDWLSMIYPRLKLAKNVLRDDGMIFISIGEHEIANLRSLCESIFGSNNFIANIVWRSRTSISADHHISANHNHTLVFAKDHSSLSFFGEPLNADEYSNPDADERGPWKLVPLDANKPGGNTNFPVQNPATGEEFLPPKGRSWSINPRTMNSLLADQRILFGIKGDSAPKRKLFLNERIAKGDVRTPSSILLDAGTTKDGTAQVTELFDEQTVFSYPKPTSLIHRLLTYGTAPGSNDIVFDFFAGSGTTAHAVIALNANDGGQRSYVCVQLPEKLDLNTRDGRIASEFCLNNDLRPHVSELTKERLRRAGAAVLTENCELKDKLDIGFRAFRIDGGIFIDTSVIPKEATQEALAGMVSHIQDDRSEEDLLFGALLRWGVDITLPIEQRELAGRKVWIVDAPEDGSGKGAALIACFAKPDSNGKGGIDTELADAMAELAPLRVLFRDDGFADDATKENVHSRFQQRAPDTQVRVL